MIERFGGQENELEEKVLSMLQDFGLEPDAITGKVLDIGAGEAEVVRFFANREDVDVTSLDSYVPDDMRDSVEKGDARSLPYESDAFDVVIAYASVPNVFIDMHLDESSEVAERSMREAIADVFSEAVRVLKPGKTAYFAPILFADSYESQRMLGDVIREVLTELRESGVSVELDQLRVETNPENNEKTKLVRVSLTKPDTEITTSS